MKPVRLSSTSSSVRQKEEELLTLDNAVDRMAAAVLIAGVTDPSIFLGPIGIWIGERGNALQMIDGRVRQPGKGLDRPRGHISKVPDAAFVPVSALPSSLAVAHALHGTRTIREVGTLAAKSSKHPLLTAIRERGGQALAERSIVEAYREAGGPLAGGVYSEEDVAALQIEAVRVPASKRASDWPTPERALEWSAVAASDSRGRLALAVFGWDPDGISLGKLGAMAPRIAIPVRRGVERARPGTLLDGLPALRWSDNGSSMVFELDMPQGSSELKVALA